MFAKIVYMYVYLLVVTFGWVFSGFLFIPTYFAVIGYVPYFGGPLFKALAPVIFVERGVFGVIDNTKSVMLLILAILLLILMVIYAFYLLVREVFPEKLFLQPFKSRILKNPIFDTLIKTGIFPLLDKIFAVIGSKMGLTQKAQTVFDLGRTYTKTILGDIKRDAMNIASFKNNDSIKLLLTTGSNDEEYKALRKSYVKEKDYSLKDNKTLEESFYKCIKENWRPINKNTKLKDKALAIAKNNTVPILCDMKNMILKTNMKQQQTTAPTGTKGIVKKI